MGDCFTIEGKDCFSIEGRDCFYIDGHDDNKKEEYILTAMKLYSFDTSSYVDIPVKLFNFDGVTVGGEVNQVSELPCGNGSMIGSAMRDLSIDGNMAYRLLLYSKTSYTQINDDGSGNVDCICHAEADFPVFWLHIYSGGGYINGVMGEPISSDNCQENVDYIVNNYPDITGVTAIDIHRQSDGTFSFQFYY